MEVVYHVHVVEVGCCSLVCHVNRMLQRNVPYRERLELSIASLHATSVLVVELREAHRHLTTTWTRGGNNHQRTRGFHIVVFAETLVRVDKFHIRWVTFDKIMVINLHSTNTLKSLTERDSA